MILVLDQIVTITNCEKSVLLMDQHCSHTTKKVSDYAISKNTTIIFVPVGLTFKYQPLDVAINGIIGCKMRSHYAKFLAGNPNKIYTHVQSLIDFILVKKGIKKGSIMRSFDCLKRLKSTNK